MRILHLIPHLSGGGAERQLTYLAAELSRMGHDVHVAYSTAGPYRTALPGVVLHRLTQQSSYDPRLLWQLDRIVRRVKPDVIHTWILQMDVLGGVVAGVNRIPWILHEQSSAMAHPRTWKNSLWVRMGSLASAIVSNSRGGDEYWRTQVPHGRRYVIANGVPIHCIDETVMILPPGLSPPEVPFALCVGRIVAGKNVEAVVAAMARVKQEQVLRCIICGDGTQRPAVEALIDRLGLNSDVQLAGYLPATAVWALMKKAAVFISLSAYEGCPNTVQEAMACGCPLVLSDIPAHREILDDSGALFVDPNNGQQAADAIVRTLRDVDASARRAVIARGMAQKWSIAEMARRFEEVYTELVSPHAPVDGRRGGPAAGEGDN